MYLNKEDKKIFYFTKKGVIFFILLWFLLYIEPLSLGFLKISQIWKAFVVLYFLVYIIKRSNTPKVVWIGIFFSAKYLIYVYMPYGLINNLQLALEAAIFPLAIGVFYFKYKNHENATDKLYNIALAISLFLLFSTIPFIFGIKGLNPELSLEKYNIDAVATKGLFYHIAVASKVFTVSTVLLLNSYKRFSNNYFNKFVWISSIVLGTYLVYASWTRTGWFVFIIAVLITFFYKSTFKKKVFAIFGVLIIFLGILYLYQTNQAFRWRLTGGAKYRTDTELTSEQLSNARLPFIVIALDNLKDEGIGAIFFGFGEKRGIDLFRIKTGMPIVPHNTTFNILESSGIIGLVLYMIFVAKLFKRVIRKSMNTNHEQKKTATLMISLFILFYLSSHGTPMFGEIIYACIFVPYIIHYKNEKNISFNRFTN